MTVEKHPIHYSPRHRFFWFQSTNKIYYYANYCDNRPCQSTSDSQKTEINNDVNNK